MAKEKEMLLVQSLLIALDVYLEGIGPQDMSTAIWYKIVVVQVKIKEAIDALGNCDEERR